MTQRKPSLDTLGQLIIEKRGDVGVRATAKEIGISPSTLSRVEGGHLPELENFMLICKWLEIDPNRILGFSKTSSKGDEPTVASVHFKKRSTVSPETAEALGEMIMRAQRAMLAEDQL